MRAIKVFIYAVSLYILFLLFGCSAFIVKDISNESIKILAPPDSFHSGSSTVTLWWEELDGAEKYDIQIVSPSFIYIVNLIADSTTSNDKFSVDLAPGQYQWRVRGVNNGWESEYSTRTFFIDSISDLANVNVNLLAPINNFSTTQTKIVFEWQTILGADEYRFQLLDDNDASIIYDVTTTNDTIHYTLTEGEYIWKVRAQNSSSNSLFSERNLAIDLTPPNVSIPISPLTGDTLVNPFTLSWDADPTSSYDSLYIYSDNTLSIPVLAILITNTSYNFTTGISGEDYSWRLKSFDAAGNASSFSISNSFLFGQ